MGRKKNSNKNYISERLELVLPLKYSAQCTPQVELQVFGRPRARGLGCLRTIFRFDRCLLRLAANLTKNHAASSNKGCWQGNLSMATPRVVVNRYHGNDSTPRLVQVSLYLLIMDGATGFSAASPLLSPPPSLWITARLIIYEKSCWLSQGVAWRGVA